MKNKKIKKIIASLLISVGVASCITLNIPEAKKETRFKKIEMDYNVIKNVNVGVIEDSNTGKKYMVVIYGSNLTDRSSMQVLEIEE